MRQWEDTMKFAPGLDALSGVKYHPWDVIQWVKVNEQKAHNRAFRREHRGQTANKRPIA